MDHGPACRHSAPQPPKALWEVEVAARVNLHAYAKEEYPGANLAPPVAYFSRESAAMNTQEAANR
jgi:hypothetical protein